MKWSDHTRIMTIAVTFILLSSGLLLLVNNTEAITFSGNHAVVSDNRDQDRLDIAAWGTGDTAEVYIAYEDYSAGPSNPHIFFQRSINAGNGFQAAQDLLVDPDGDDKQLYPALDVYTYNDTRTIALAYLDNSPGTTSIEFYIMVQTSTDGGSTWSTAVQVTDDAHAGYPNNKMNNIDIAYDPNGNIYIVWLESGTAMMAYSTDNGITWSAPQQVKDHPSPENPSYSQFRPTIAADGDYVMIAWDTDVHFKNDVYLSRASTSSLSGYPALSFETPKRMPKPIVYPMYRTYSPRLVAQEDVAYIVWWDFSTDPNGNDNADTSIDRPCIKFSKSTNGGNTWGVGSLDNVIVNTSTPDGWHSQPDIEVSENGYLAVTWIDTTLKHKNVYSSVSADGGNTWSTQARTNDYDPSAEKFPPKVAIDSSNTVHVAWKARASPTSDLDLFHSRTIINQPPMPITGLSLIFAEEFDAMIGWTINKEPDFKLYNIHLDTTENFIISQDNLYKTTTNQGLNLQNLTNLIPNTDYYVRIQVEDQEGLTAESTELHFKTLPINQPPSFNKPIPTIYLDEDTSSPGALNLSLWVEQGWISDDNYAGQTEIQFDIIPISDEPKVTALFRDRGIQNPYWILDINTNTPNWAGSELFQIKATDAGKDGGFGTPDDKSSLSDTFNITVNSTNDLPIWKTYQDLNTNQQIQIISDQKELTLKPTETGCIERQLYRFAMIGSDIDGDFITYTISDPRITIERDLVRPDVKSIFSFTPTNNDVPEINFTITADDGRGATRTIRIFLPILNVNDAPFFITVDEQTVEGNGDKVEFAIEEKGTFSFNVTAGDIDHGDKLTLSSNNDRADVKVNNNTQWTVTFTAKEEDSVTGEVEFQLQLLDLQKTDLVFLTVNVQILNIQDRPEWIQGKDRVTVTYNYDLQDQNEWGGKGGSEIRAEWGEDVTFEGFATDKDNDPLTYTWWFSTQDEKGNWSVEGKKVDFAFQPSEGGLENPLREKFRITLTVSDGKTEPIQYYRELWVDKDDDNDNDGLPDARERFFWKSLSHEPYDDEDGDGDTNIDEIGFQIPRYDSEMSSVYSINIKEVNPLDPESWVGHPNTTSVSKDPSGNGDDTLIEPWLMIMLIIIAVILISLAAGFIVILRISKVKEKKEEDDIERRVQKMEARQKEISTLYGTMSADEVFGPDQSTLSDLKLDLGGQVYHEEGSGALAKGVKKGKLEEDKDQGPRWESTTGPLFEGSAPGLSFGQSLDLDENEIGKSEPDEEDLGRSLEELEEEGSRSTP